MDWSVLKLLLRQPLNSWKSLTRPARLQHAVLLLLIYAYFGSRLFSFANGLRVRDAQAWLYLVWGSGLALTLIFLITAPVLFHRLLPAQPEFRQFLELPLRPNQLFSLVFYVVHKYWLVLWAFFLPLPVILLGQNVPLALALLALTIAADVLAVYVFFQAFFRFHSLPGFYGLSLGITLLTAAGCYFLRKAPGLWPFGLGGLQLSLLLIAWGLKHKAHPDIERWRFFLPRFARSSAQYHSHDFAKGRFKALFLRDWLKHVRNPVYWKAKGFLVVLLLVAWWLVFGYYPPETALPIFSLTWLGLIWWHFSTAFSRQYAQSEPDWFLRLTPLPFLRFVLARFLNEYGFVLLFLAFYAGLLCLAGFSLQEQWQWIVLLLFFSAVILLTVIAFGLMFYDDPRTAGYAYHLSLIFFAVMSLNYYFVGPILTFVFLLAFFYASYRFLKQ